MTMHRLLVRQLRKHLGKTEGFPEDLQRLLSAIDEAYQHHDDDRAMTERSMDLSSAELLARNDELALNLKRLKELQRQLVDASRRMGMADVASAVLHNVGNVLNSVNVSAGVVADRVRRSKLRGLTQAAEMIRSHDGDRGWFFTQDEKGKRLPDFFCMLADASNEERNEILKELETLQRNVDHIKVIVSTQQSHAKSGGVTETLVLREIMEDALKVSFDTHERFQVICELQGPQRVTVDRHKLLQILLNLMSNARHAVRDSDTKNGRITIRTRTIDAERFVIEISDTGVGISSENLAKIFTHGFTTKKNGHGFGLHSSSCAALELGGTLTASSDGPGLGAQFRLELPTALRGSKVAPKGESVAASLHPKLQERQQLVIATLPQHRFE
jgi:signal transduction histidine kinase